MTILQDLHGCLCSHLHKLSCLTTVLMSKGGVYLPPVPYPNREGAYRAGQGTHIHHSSIVRKAYLNGELCKRVYECQILDDDICCGRIKGMGNELVDACYIISYPSSLGTYSQFGPLSPRVWDCANHINVSEQFINFAIQVQYSNDGDLSIPQPNSSVEKQLVDYLKDDHRISLVANRWAIYAVGMEIPDEVLWDLLLDILAIRNDASLNGSAALAVEDKIKGQLLTMKLNASKHPQQEHSIQAPDSYLVDLMASNCEDDPVGRSYLVLFPEQLKETFAVNTLDNTYQSQLSLCLEWHQAFSGVITMPRLTVDHQAGGDVKKCINAVQEI
ncbi:hypothetical protein FIBSPDRAFT_881520 [Athelia psychrophila]|uniref:Uncharacterized protein n=1 Tax=Athelia psychrophila TaxID=1759441 RepID=A0A166WSN2_9AGAM|nr:hypothetical protein FIBSPDRAFT_881520 [Fibularhizoctonia sp. CBS 109695]